MYLACIALHVTLKKVCFEQQNFFSSKVEGRQLRLSKGCSKCYFCLQTGAGVVWDFLFLKRTSLKIKEKKRKEKSKQKNPHLNKKNRILCCVSRACAVCGVKSLMHKIKPGGRAECGVSVQGGGQTKWLRDALWKRRIYSVCCFISSPP